MNRVVLLVIAGLVGCAVIAVLSLVLESGGSSAVLLLDMRPDTPLPYPLTLQNLMTLLFTIGIGDVIFRRGHSAREASATHLHLLPETPRAVLRANDLGAIRNRALACTKTQPLFLADLIEQCVLQFQSGQSVADTHHLLGSMGDLEMHRLDLRYTLLRYIAWVIPTLGFIGTVLGIAGALSALGGAAGDNPADGLQMVIGPLGMAFNTTILALILSAILVLLIQTAQRTEEQAINDSSEYCLRNLINRLHVPHEHR